ncbi:ethylene-insensitive protein 2.2-like [Tasmannia lanceolata]|uniref:ethylene-insensitive protein 2.2-like n=1 Tax=Tasmannia lanceolata TaxID=3420 RepID=UPI004062811C
MDTEASSDIQMSSIVPRLFPSLGPALLISMGYIDPGKWAAAVDGGARFGFDLVSLVLAFNCAAILCHYLTARIGVVTGKNLAQICSEEYSRPTCILLGVQAELSVIVLELTMILGIAHGLNLILGLEMFTCVLLTVVDMFLFPFLMTLPNKCKTEMFFISIAGFGLFSYVLGVLISQPEIPVAMNGVFPRLRGESAYSLMSLLGANIMPHNFYLHSSIVQKQQRLPSVSLGALCHDHLFAILCTFSVIFLVNNVVMLSAATVFHNAGLAVLTFQDSLLLMDQIFQSPIAPVAFFLVLFLTNQVTAITWNVGGRLFLHDFFGIDAPVWIHRVTVKGLAIIPALYCAWNSGAEGIYQLLIYCQVVSAMLLPSSVIPLFRVASSNFIMGAFKISGFVEVLAMLTFLGMLGSNIIFILELLFGDSDWTGNLRWNMGSGYIVLLLIGCASFGFMLWLAATPLKSASECPDIQIWNRDSQKAIPEPSQNREESELNKTRYDGDEEPVAEEAASEKSTVSLLDNSVGSYLDLPETIMDSDNEPHQSAAGSHLENSTSAVDLAPCVTVSEVSAVGLSDASKDRVESKESVEKTVGIGGPLKVLKDDEADVCELEEPPVETFGSIPISTFDGPGSFKSISGKNDDSGNGSGSLSRLCGLGRAARRQLASILDEFWGQLYDFHGQLTKEARAKGIDVIWGLDSKPVASSIKADTLAMDYSTKYFSEAERVSAFPTNSMDYDSPKHQRILGGVDSPYGVQRGPSSWSSSIQSLHAFVQSSGSNLLDASERRYSSLRLPTYPDARDYQPATMHGYQIPSYLSRNTESLSIPLDPSTPKSTSLVPNYKDPLTYSLGQNRLGSLHTSSMQNPAMPLINRLQSERNYYDSLLVGSGTNGNVGSTTHPKKYHSLPDISGLAVSARNSSLADKNAQWGSPIGPGPSKGRTPYEQSLYLNTTSRAEGVPLAFDELSPSKLYQDAFSLPLRSNVDTKSLWSKQPFEQLFGIAGKPQSGTVEVLRETVSHVDSESKLLQSFRYCIMKLLKLEGADWLFQQNGGFDEGLIDLVAARESFLYEAETREVNRIRMGESLHMSSDRKFGSVPKIGEADLAKFLVSSVPNCGGGCIWQVGLIVSFGVWCIRRILELSLMESRPELWGKYTYVLNRLQGILDLAFFKPRPPISPCFCLQVSGGTVGKRSGPLLSDGISFTIGKLNQGRTTTASMLLDLIKDVEAAVSGRKGRTGTAAGDVAFPKGKENLASVLKRYKRRLSTKSTSVHEGGSGPRKGPVPASTFPA